MEIIFKDLRRKLENAFQQFKKCETIDLNIATAFNMQNEVIQSMISELEIQRGKLKLMKDKDEQKDSP